MSDFFTRLAASSSIGTALQVLTHSPFVDSFTVANGRITFTTKLHYTFNPTPKLVPLYNHSPAPLVPLENADTDSESTDGKDEMVGDADSDPAGALVPSNRTHRRAELAAAVRKFCQLAQGVRGLDGTVQCTRQPKTNRTKMPCINMHNGHLCPFVHRNPARHAAALVEIISSNEYKGDNTCPYGDKCLWVDAPVMCVYRHYVGSGDTNANNYIATVLGEITDMVDNK